MKMRDNYPHALCEDEEGERFLVYCPNGDDDEAIGLAEYYGFAGVSVLNWLDEAEAGCSGLDEW